jgi:predicted dehydrogenase
MAELLDCGLATFVPLRLGIVGAGRAARSLHVPALLRLQDTISVRAVADVDADSARAVGSLFPNATVSPGALELIASPDIDAVAILTPPATHTALVLHALRAGKHVFIEKPLAATVEDANAVVQAARESGCCAVAGHNLRFHRLVRRAADAVRSGALGRLTEIETTWNSPAAGGPQWQTDRTLGGGVIFDLGVHHVDLARFLTSSEFDHLSATIDSEARDDLRASASGVLANGVKFSARWTKESHAAHTVRLVGTLATAEFSMYSAISWRLTPAALTRRASDFASDCFHAIRNRSSGGDSAESYRFQWLDFARAIRTGSAPACPVEEAAKNIAWCGVMLAAVPSPEPVPPVPAKQNLPSLSVVLGVRGNYATVRRTVRHIRSQDVREQIELILLWASEEEVDVPPQETEGFFNVIVERISAASPVAAANAAGVRLANAPVVAMAEDHCFAQPGWAAALIQAHARGYAAVGPEIANANPGNVVSWCDFLIGYGPWISPCAPGEASFLPGHNCSYKRDALLAYGDRLESMLEAEAVLHFDLVRQGHRLFLEPRARVSHLNFALWRIWLPVLYHCGRAFGGTRAAGWPLSRKAFYAAASPLIPLVRLVRIAGELLKPNRPRRLLPRLAPALALGLLCDGAGQFIGYLAGVGRSPEILGRFEYNRVLYIRPQDRRALELADRHVEA